MVSTEYERGIAARFAGFDQDGNGYIDREDFNAAAKPGNASPARGASRFTVSE